MVGSVYSVDLKPVHTKLIGYNTRDMDHVWT